MSSKRSGTQIDPTAGIFNELAEGKGGAARSSVHFGIKRKECRRHTEQLTADHYHLNDRQYGPIVKWPPPSSYSSGHLCNTQRKVNGSCTIVSCASPQRRHCVSSIIISIRSDFQLSVGEWVGGNYAVKMIPKK